MMELNPVIKGLSLYFLVTAMSYPLSLYLINVVVLQQENSNHVHYCFFSRIRKSFSLKQTTTKIIYFLEDNYGFNISFLTIGYYHEETQKGRLKLSLQSSYAVLF